MTGNTKSRLEKKSMHLPNQTQLRSDNPPIFSKKKIGDRVVRQTQVYNSTR